jgi:DNA polymerase
VTDPRELFARYLRQRAAMGEGQLILDGVPVADTPVAGPPRRSPTDAGERRTPPTAPPGSSELVRARPPELQRASSPAAARGRADWRRGAPPVPPIGLMIPAPEKDLFSADPLASMDLSQLADAVHACTRCVLCRERTNAVPGEGPGDARLVVVGEGPGATEDETGRPFVGRAGQLLTEILAAIELPRERVFICNVVKCRPPSNRKPLQDEMDACVPYLYRQLDVIQPKVILAMGNTAAETLLNTKQSLGSLRGRVHQFRGMPLIVTYHPAALLRNPHWKKPTWDDVRIARQLVDA